MAIARAAMWASVAFLLAAPGVVGNSVYVAEKCQGGECTNPKFPMLDFDREEGTCVCRAHPCWNNDGIEHKCPDPESPHLRFSYDGKGILQCGCGKTPVMDSVHVARDLCAGEACPSDEFPITDWDAEGGKCICRENPCTEDAQGIHHSCEDVQFPLLHFRIEPDTKSQRCDCFMKLERPQSNLRGQTQDVPQAEACTWRQSPTQSVAEVSRD
jgi:hypothetical protein